MPLPNRAHFSLTPFLRRGTALHRVHIRGTRVSLFPNRGFISLLTPLPASSSINFTRGAFHFLNRKNCAPLDIELVTKNWPPETAGMFVQSNQVAEVRLGED